MPVLPYASEEYGRDRSVSLYRRIADAIFEASLYPWMLRDAIALDIMRLAREIMDDVRSAFYRAVLQKFVLWCDFDVLDENGRGRSMPRFYGETHVDYRRRLAAFKLWHSFAGWRQGWFRALEFFGVSAQGVHRFTSSVPMWSAVSIDAFKIYESAASDLKWLVAVERSDGSEDVYYFNSGAARFAWLTAADSSRETILEHGVSAAELEALSSAHLSDLLPCGNITFITTLENENWWTERGIFADVEATIYI